MFGAGVHLKYHGAALGQAQGGLEAFGQALLHVVAHLQAVDHDVDVVLLGLFQLGQVAKFNHFAVDAKAHIALGLHLRKQVAELALAIARHRCEHHDLGISRQGQRGIDHLRDGLGRQRVAVGGAVRCAGAREQQAQVVVDLGDGADRGTRVVAGGFLLDGDGGREALDHIDIGLVHARQKLAGIGREAFHIAALALGIEGVKGERGLARPGQPGDHHQLIAGDVQVDVLQVVGARATNRDALRRQG